MLRRFLSAPIDWVLLTVPTILTITGIITIFTITFAQEKSGLAGGQIIFALIGMTALIAAMFSDYRHLSSLANLFYFFGVAMLVLLIPPLAVKIPFTLKIFGAYRWLDLGFFQLQPGEIFKLIAAIFGAKILTQHIGLIDWKKTLVYVFFSVVPISLVLLQPDLGTSTVILVVFTAAFLAARPSGRIITTILVIFIISLPLIWANLRPYQQNRVETLLNPTSDPQGQGYNVRQSLIAIGSGGLTGRGFGQGSQTVLN